MTYGIGQEQLPSHLLPKPQGNLSKKANINDFEDDDDIIDYFL